MKKTLGILSLMVGIGFAQEMIVSERQNDFFRKVPESQIKNGMYYSNFCIDGLLYRALLGGAFFHPLMPNTYKDANSLAIIEETLHQVIGADGKPMTCKTEKKVQQKPQPQKTQQKEQ